MSLNATPSSERVHIGFFGRTNAGKSSVVNAVTNQELSIVSDISGTTTDPVVKAMELKKRYSELTPSQQEYYEKERLEKEQANTVIE